MAEFELFDSKSSGGSSTKNLLKNKKFLAACGVTAVVALVLWYIKQRNAENSGTDYYEDGTMAIGYGGYPNYSGTDDSYNGWDESWQILLDNQEDKWQNLLDQQEDKYNQLLDKYDNTIANMEDKYENLLDKVDNMNVGSSVTGYSSGVTSVRSTIDEQAIIDQMKANSEMWWYTTNKTGQEQLHQQNQQLAAQIGADYDSATGTYWKNGQQLYTVDSGKTSTLVTGMGTKNASSGVASYVPNVDYQARINEAIRNNAGAATINALNEQRNNKIAATGNTSANTTYDKNTDYQALINSAKAQGASQQVIDNLTAQRNAKIKGENLTVN